MGRTSPGNNSMKAIPSVDKVLGQPVVSELMSRFSRDLVVEVVRGELERVRSSVHSGALPPSPQAIADTVASTVSISWSQWPRPVINGTGVILHTNMGRSPLSASSLDAIHSAGGGYSDLELDLQDGRRGSRQHPISVLLSQLIGAESGLVVNNNAAAIMLGLAAIAFGKEVIVSRGESSEIGGGFRIPDVLKQSGARLIEVGTVNRTYAADYEQAITNKTAAILVVHRSNFSVIGFTHEPSLKDIIDVGTKHGVPVLHDIGGGALLNTSDFGLAHEPMPQESIALGSDLVFFSGDKLLGGPQAGIIVGKSGPIGKLERHPLMRVLRSDKVTLASLHATLLHYVRGEAITEIPIWRMISTPLDTIKRRSLVITKSLGSPTSACMGNSTIGGGSLPGEELESWLVRVGTSGTDGGAAGFARKLRMGTPSIVSRIEEEDVLLDLRTILPEDDHLVEGRLSAELKAV